MDSARNGALLLLLICSGYCERKLSIMHQMTIEYEDGTIQKLEVDLGL